jgi:hypothetical protein
MVIPTQGALARAFSQAVQAESQPATESEGRASHAPAWFVGLEGQAVGPMRLSELSEKAAKGGVGADSLVWREGFEEWKPLKAFPELLAIAEENLSEPVLRRGPPSDAPSTFPDVLPQSRGGLGPWVAVVVASLLGLTLGWFIWKKEPPPPIIEYREVGAKSSASLQSGPTEMIPMPPSATSTEARPATAGSFRARGAAPPSQSAAAPSGLAGLRDLGAQTRGPSGEQPGAAAPAGQLDSASVQKTVSRYRNSVKRSCWQPALDTRDREAPTSARVVVTMTVTPGGRAQDVTTTGDPPGYRGLASCIAAHVAGWEFPPGSDSSTVNVPFVFAAQ